MTEVRVQSMCCSGNDNWVAQIMRFPHIIVFVYKSFLALLTGMMERWNAGILGNGV